MFEAWLLLPLLRRLLLWCSGSAVSGNEVVCTRASPRRGLPEHAVARAVIRSLQAVAVNSGASSFHFDTHAFYFCEKDRDVKVHLI